MKKILYTILFAISASCLIPENLAAQTKLAFDGPYAGVSLGLNQTHVSEGGVVVQYSFSPGSSFDASEENDITGNGKNSKSNGFIKGLNFGYDYRINNFVIGGEFGASTLGGTANGYASMDSTKYSNAKISSSTKISSLFIAKPKVGFVFDNKTMVYGMAGLARGKIKRTILDLTSIEECSCVWWANNAPLSSSQNKFGYTLGIGAETMITDNFSLKFEINYVNLGTISSKYSGSLDIVDGAFVSLEQSTKITNKSTTLGLSYKF